MLFEFTNVSKNYGIHKIFRNLNFSLERATFSILTGPSGSGKTTLFRMLCGLERPSEGEIVFLGKRLTEHSAAHLKQIGLVFQNPRGLLDWTVYKNIEVPLLIDGVGEAERSKRVNHWLDVLGLRHRANSLYGELSGGEVQKAEFARAVIRKPRLILADEPTAHLDAIQSDVVLDALWELYQDGATVFISTHHPPTFDHPKIDRYHIAGQSVRKMNGQSNRSDDVLRNPYEVNHVEVSH
jgi:cell division transport system ATP-binding protein